MPVRVLAWVVVLAGLRAAAAQTAALTCAASSSTSLFVDCSAVGGLCGSATSTLDKVVWDSGSASCPPFPSSNCTAGSPQNCAVESCTDSAWTPWSDCSVSCGAGQSLRNRTVVVRPYVGTAYCVNLFVHRGCDADRPCPEEEPLFPTGWLVVIGILVGALFCTPLASKAFGKRCPCRNKGRSTWRGRPTKSSRHKVFTDPAVVNRPQGPPEPPTNVIVRRERPAGDPAATPGKGPPAPGAGPDRAAAPAESKPARSSRPRPTPTPKPRGKGAAKVLPMVDEDESIDVPAPGPADPFEVHKGSQFDRGVAALGGRPVRSGPNTARSAAGSTISSVTFVSRRP